jgi:cortexillin 1/2
MSVENIQTDLDDGVRLINFLELLTSKKVSQKWDPKPPSRIQKISNLHIALTFLDKEIALRGSGASAEDFADHNLKMILGFLWTMYKKYRIAVIKHEDKSSEEGLLLWCKQKTAGYRDVTIESYKHSFKSGMAFLALCDSFLEGNKEILDYDKYNKEDLTSNLNAAFDVAETNLGIPKLLDAEDVAEGNVDERSMVLYISLFFHAFTAKEQQKGVLEERERLERDMKGLQGSLEERARLAAELEEENRKLKERVAQLEAELKTERESKEELSSELARLRLELEAEKKKTSELAESKLQLEGQVFSLEGQVSELTEKFNTEFNARKKENEENSSTSATQLRGLSVLKKNLEEHIEDLYRWQNYLDFDKVSEVDFSGEIRPQILTEITKSNYDEQLKYLSDKLEKENTQLLDLLKTKEAEKQQLLLKEKEKKQRQKERK